MTRAKYPARAHAANVVRELFRALPSRSTRKHLVYLVGEITRERHDTDRELPFHQESNFFCAACPALPWLLLTRPQI